MEISRNQYFLIGVVLLLVGLQVHMIDTIELTAECTQLLAERTGRPSAAIAANVRRSSPQVNRWSKRHSNRQNGWAGR